MKRQKKLTSTRCKCESFAKNPQNKNCSSTESWQLQIFKKLNLLRCCYFVIIFLRQLKTDMQNFFEMNNFHEFFKLLFVVFCVAVYLYLSNFCQSTKCSQSVTEKLINLVNNTAVRCKSKFRSRKLFKKFHFRTLICIKKPLRITLAPNVDHFKRNYTKNLRLIILFSNTFLTYYE